MTITTTLRYGILFTGRGYEIVDRHTGTGPVLTERGYEIHQTRSAARSRAEEMHDNPPVPPKRPSFLDIIRPALAAAGIDPKGA